MQEVIKTDLISLWECNYIERVKTLNENLGNNYFHANTLPMHFSGNYKAKTVMVMLNPGSHDPDFNFFQTDYFRKNTVNEFIKEHIDNKINYGEKDKKRHDNFDLKQAAFLYNWDDEDLLIPREFWQSTELKLLAKRNVLMNKYQLEFIPFASRSFGGLLDNLKQAQKNFPIFEPYLVNILDEIFSEERKHVVFCSKQFNHLFAAASKNSVWKNTFFSDSPKGIKIGKLTLNCNKVTINHKGKFLTGIIAHSFASQALPNAYEKMIRYGNFCFSELNTR